MTTDWDVAQDVAVLDRTYAEVLERFTPPEPLTVSEWAAKYRVLSSYAAEPGRWHNERTPYLREIMDVMSDDETEMVVFQKCARIGGTEAGMNVIGYFMHHDPSPILVMQPNVGDAEDWSKEQLAPMIADTPVLACRVRDSRSRDSGNTILHKVFDGGTITGVGSNSAKGLRRRTIRVAFGDEVDAWSASAGGEGDPLTLFLNRTITYPDRKIFLASTPVWKDLSKIEEQYLASDMRRYYVPCPHCNHMQTLVWERLRYQDDPDQPQYLCEGCDELISEEHKAWMVAGGEWRPSAPFTGLAGFHINALYSPFDGTRWPRLVKEWTAAQDNTERLQVFVNTVLGETWEIRGARAPEGLVARVEVYPPNTLPDGVVLLTLAVDVQDDRIEYKVKGWGAGEESWLIVWGVLHGPTGEPEVWGELDAVFATEYVTADGEVVKVASTCVDSGHMTDMVYRWVAKHRRRVYAIKGSSRRYRPVIPKRATAVKRFVRLYEVGTDTAKDMIFARLRVLDPGPLHMHFPDTVDEEYFRQLTAEKCILQKVHGNWVRQYVKIRDRNEALDLEVYSLAALLAWGTPRRLDRLASQRPEPEATEPEPEATEPAVVGMEAAAVETKRMLRGRRGKRKWVSGWK